MRKSLKSVAEPPTELNHLAPFLVRDVPDERLVQNLIQSYILAQILKDG